MNNIFILISILIISPLSLIKAQSLEDLYLKKNYKEVMKEMGKDDKYYKEADKKAQKEFDRWCTFWSTRVDSSGSLLRLNEAINNINFDDLSIPTSTLKSAPLYTWEPHSLLTGYFE